jgi:hypothetical protein
MHRFHESMPSSAAWHCEDGLFPQAVDFRLRRISDDFSLASISSIENFSLQLL